jgi:nitrogen-specific signal transduction histidine kinase
MTNTTLDAEELWNVAWTYIQTVVHTACEPFVVLDKNLCVISANTKFYAFFHTNAKDTAGKLVYDLGDGEWNMPRLRLLLEDILPDRPFYEDFSVEHNFPTIGDRAMAFNARRVCTDDNTEPIILLAMRDVSQQSQLDQQQKTHTKELGRAVARRTAELEIRVIELERLNTLMLDREMKMIELKTELKQLKAFRGDRRHADMHTPA